MAAKSAKPVFRKIPGAVRQDVKPGDYIMMDGSMIVPIPDSVVGMMQAMNKPAPRVFRVTSQGVEIVESNAQEATATKIKERREELRRRVDAARPEGRVPSPLQDLPDEKVMAFMRAEFAEMFAADGLPDEPSMSAPVEPEPLEPIGDSWEDEVTEPRG